MIWVMILSLWAIMVYQYMEEEESQTMTYVANPFKEPAPQPRPDDPPLQPLPAPGVSRAGVPTPQPPVEILPAPILPPTPEPGDELPMQPIPPKLQAARPTRHTLPLRREIKIPAHDPPIPPGFAKTPTRHFNIYAEGGPAGETLLETLENLHGNLMLDLAAFSPWAREEKVSLFLFKSQETYRKVTGRPAWSGGASSVPKRKVYLYESEELNGILAHELCHIFYDGFFLGAKPNPLWLSEGMATLVQVERGLAAPNWLRENLEILSADGGFALTDLMRVRSTAGSSDDNVRLWYTQSYSLVRFLIRTQYRSSFYNFSRHLRDGKSAQESLYRAYGMPYTSLKALETAWRRDIRVRKDTR